MPVVAAAMVAVLLAVLPPLYFGGIFWWLPTALLSACVLLLAWLAGYCHNGSSFKYLKLQTGRPAWRWSYLLLLLPILAGLLTLIPVGAAFLARISPFAAKIWAAVPLAKPRVTLEPGATWDRIALLALCLFVYVWCRCNCRNANGLLFTVAALTVGATANAFIAMAQLFGGAGGTAAVNGAFLNRNHFGFMMSLGICGAAALSGYLMPEKRSVAVSKKRGPRVASQVAGKETMLGVLDLSSDTHGEERSTQGSMLARLALVVAIFIMYCAQLACLSRGAFLAGTAAIVLLTVRQLFRQRGGSRRIRRNFYAILVVVGGAILFATPFILQRLSNRFEDAIFQDSLTADARVQVWNASCQMIRKYWLTGTGLGTYRDGIQQFATPEMPDGLVVHAHNDWLEMTAEGGLPFTALMLLGLAAGLAVALRRLHRQPDGRLRWVGHCAAIALLTGAFHEWFDFNLQAYPVAVAFAVMAAVMNACGDPAPTELDRENAEAMRRERHAARIRRAVAVCICLVLLLIGLPLGVRYLRAEIAHTRLWSALQTAGTGGRILSVPPAEKARRAAVASARLPYSSAVHFRAATLYAGLAAGASEPLDALRFQRQALYSQRQGLRARPGSVKGWADYAACQMKADAMERRQRGRSLAPDERPPWLDSLEQMVVLGPTMADNLDYAARCHLLVAARIDPVKGTALQRELRALSLIRAVELFQQLVTQRPDRFKEVLPLLLDIDSDPRWVLHAFPVARLPQNYTLVFNQLLHRRLYGPAQAMLAGLPQEFMSEATVLQKAQLAAQRYSLARLNGAPPEEVARLWDAWKAAHRAFIDEFLKDRMPAQDEKEARVAPATLLKSLAEVPGGYVPEALQSVADYALAQGDGESAVMALLYETYTLPYEPSAADLQAAMRTVERMSLADGAKAERHLRFLRAALPVRLAWLEHGGASENESLRTALETLEALAQPVRVSGRADAAVQPQAALEWHQRHLYTYYAALAAELLGDMPKAVALHKRTLETCRTHAPTLLRLREIAPDALEKGGWTEMAEVASALPCSLLDITAMLMQMHAAPDTLANLYSDLTLTVWIQAMVEAPAPTVYKAYCSTAQDSVAGCDLKATDGRNNPQIWQNGALVKCHGVFPMLPLNLVQGTRGHMADEGWLEIHVARSGGLASRDAIATPSYKLRQVRLHLKHD